MQITFNKPMSQVTTAEYQLALLQQQQQSSTSTGSVQTNDSYVVSLLNAQSSGTNSTVQQLSQLINSDLTQAINSGSYSQVSDITDSISRAVDSVMQQVYAANPDVDFDAINRAIDDGGHNKNISEFVRYYANGKQDFAMWLVIAGGKIIKSQQEVVRGLINEVIDDQQSWEDLGETDPDTHGVSIKLMMIKQILDALSQSVQTITNTLDVDAGQKKNITQQIRR